MVFFVLSLLLDERLAEEVVFKFGGKERERQKVRETVELFNRKFMDIYASGGARAALEGFPASKEVRNEIFRDIGTLRLSTGYLIIYDMANLEIKEVGFIDSRRAAVGTFEEWNYIIQDARTRRALDRPMGLGYYFAYNLVRDGDDWSVVSYTPEEPEKAEKEYERGAGE